MKKIGLTFLSLILLSIVLMLQSCWLNDDSDINKVCNSDCTIIEGRFTTEDGNVVIANVGLEFNWGIQPTPGGLGAGKTRKIATTKTDENGEYRIQFYAEDEELIGGSFSVEFKVPDNSYLIIPDNNYFEFNIGKRDTLVVRNYHIPKKGGTIEIRIKNPQDIKGDDNLTCYASYKFDDLKKSIESFAGGLNSAYASEATISTAANQYTYIQMTKKIGGQYINSLDSVIVSLNATRIYEVEF